MNCGNEEMFAFGNGLTFTFALPDIDVALHPLASDKFCIVYIPL